MSIIEVMGETKCPANKDCRIFSSCTLVGPRVISTFVAGPDTLVSDVNKKASDFAYSWENTTPPECTVVNNYLNGQPVNVYKVSGYTIKIN